MDEDRLLERITIDPKILGGEPIIRGRRLAVEHVLAMLAAGDSVDTILGGYPWLQRQDVQALPRVPRIRGTSRRDGSEDGAPLLASPPRRLPR
jgi:uncharacterized protein (DUF433 family)